MKHDKHKCAKNDARTAAACERAHTSMSRVWCGVIKWKRVMFLVSLRFCELLRLAVTIETVTYPMGHVNRIENSLE